MNRGFRDVWRWKRTSHPAPWPKKVEMPAAVRPPRSADVRVTWLGHATVLIETPAGNFLTDPVFSARAGPFGLLGPRRVHPPAIELDQLPPIAAILLSHDHYDHCDLASLRQLARRSRHTQLVTPLGNGDLGRRAGFAPETIHERDWWEAIARAEGVRVTLTPARHWSNRLRGPRNGRLWSGFFLQFENRSVYYSGDTAYDDQMFHDIARRLGPPDLAILPIGAYEPRWFMAAQHCNPEEAVQIHQELGARRSFGVHWGTFQLTDESREAPVEALRQARAAAGAENTFMLVAPGEPVCL